LWFPPTFRLHTEEISDLLHHLPYSISRWSRWGITALRLRETEALADKLETPFQLMTDPSVPAGIKAVDVALRSYFLTPTSEPRKTNPDYVQKAIRGLRVSLAPGPNGIPNRVLKHLPQRAVSFQAQIFRAVLLTYHIRIVWKHARVICSLKLGRIRHCPHPIDPLVSWIWLVNYLE
jgi:hypothetical protein